jgi:hypothetical protein
MKKITSVSEFLGKYVGRSLVDIKQDILDRSENDIEGMTKGIGLIGELTNYLSNKFEQSDSGPLRIGISVSMSMEAEARRGPHHPLNLSGDSDEFETVDVETRELDVNFVHDHEITGNVYKKEELMLLELINEFFN